MPSTYFRLVFLLSVLLVGSARAAQVLSIAKDNQSMSVSQRSTGIWRPAELICVLHEMKEVACGNVTESAAESATVKLLPGAGIFAVGDFVEAGTASKAGLQTKAMLPENVRLIHHYDHRVGAIIEAGPSYVFPGGEFQYALDRRTAIGITGGYWAASPSQASLTGMGGYVSLSFYQAHCFQGLWLGINLGGYSLTARANGLEESVKTLAAGANFGWDVRLSNQLSLRLAGGGRYLSRPLAKAISYELHPWLMFFNGSLGWQF